MADEGPQKLLTYQLQKYVSKFGTNNAYNSHQADVPRVQFGGLAFTVKATKNVDGCTASSRSREAASTVNDLCGLGGMRDLSISDNRDGTYSILLANFTDTSGWVLEVNFMVSCRALNRAHLLT
eukprot:SAG31_NODE_218_length_19934_cov_81.634837_9_plen_124_part_00